MDNNCIFCNQLQHDLTLLDTTENFYLIAEKYPIVKGTILIIPKKHYSCYGAIPKKLENEFIAVKSKVEKFITENYHSPVIFLEHGIEGQTIFHAHLHCLPFNQSLLNIITQQLGNKYTLIKNLSQLKKEFKRLEKYFYYQENNKSYVFEVGRLSPGYIRILFANTLNCPQKANWKTANPNLFTEDLNDLLQRWHSNTNFC